MDTQKKISLKSFLTGMAGFGAALGIASWLTTPGLHFDSIQETIISAAVYTGIWAIMFAGIFGILVGLSRYAASRKAIPGQRRDSDTNQKNE